MATTRLSPELKLNLGLASLRAAVGTVFLAHGAQKVFQYGFAGVAGAFGQMGIPFAGITGPAVGLLELIGGAALVVGLFTRLAALGLGVNMLGAILLVHLPAGFFLPSGVEFVLALLGSSILLALTGAGGFSLDALLAGRRETAATNVQLVRPDLDRRAA